MISATQYSCAFMFDSETIDVVYNIISAYQELNNLCHTKVSHIENI